MFIRWEIPLNLETTIYIEHIHKVLNERTTLADELPEEWIPNAKESLECWSGQSTEYRAVEGYLVNGWRARSK